MKKYNAVKIFTRSKYILNKLTFSLIFKRPFEMLIK